MTVTTRVNKLRLDGLILQLSPRSHAAVDLTANNIRDRAASLAPRRTGSLAESIYVGTPDGSDYSQRAGDARSTNPTAIIVSEVTSSEVLSLSGGSSNAYVDVVGVAVQHGVFNELGTRFMSAQPFIFPSVEPERDAFVSAMSHVADV